MAHVPRRPVYSFPRSYATSIKVTHHIKVIDHSPLSVARSAGNPHVGEVIIWSFDRSNAISFPAGLLSFTSIPAPPKIKHVLVRTSTIRSRRDWLFKQVLVNKSSEWSGLTKQMSHVIVYQRMIRNWRTMCSVHSQSGRVSWKKSVGSTMNHWSLPLVSNYSLFKYFFRN